jgi:hypothetical protein
MQSPQLAVPDKDFSAQDPLLNIDYLGTGGGGAFW